MDANQLLDTLEKKNKDSYSTQKKNKDPSFDNVMSSISKNWENEPLSEVKDLKARLALAEERIQELKRKNINSDLTKNEEKIIAAIRSEQINQNNEQPVISTSALRKKYKVSAKYQGQSIKNLTDRGFIERIESPYSGNVKTFRWKILKNEQK